MFVDPLVAVNPSLPPPDFLQMERGNDATMNRFYIYKRRCAHAWSVLVDNSRQKLNEEIWTRNVLLPFDRTFAVTPGRTSELHPLQIVRFTRGSLHSQETQSVRTRR